MNIVCRGLLQTQRRPGEGKVPLLGSPRLGVPRSRRLILCNARGSARGAPPAPTSLLRMRNPASTPGSRSDRAASAARRSAHPGRAEPIHKGVEGLQTVDIDRYPWTAPKAARNG